MDIRKSVTVDDLMKKIADTGKEYDTDKIRRAFELGAAAHFGR